MASNPAPSRLCMLSQLSISGQDKIGRMADFITFHDLIQNVLLRELVYNISFFEYYLYITHVACMSSLIISTTIKVGINPI